MSKYDAEIASAAADIAAAGTTCTLTLGAVRDRDPITDAASGAAVVVAGHPVAILSVGPRDAEMFGGAIDTKRQRRFLIPADGLPQAPVPGDRIAVGGRTYGIAQVKSIEPDGVPIIHTLYGQA